MTWEFKGPDDVWRTIYGGTDGQTAQVFTDVDHMINGYFANDVKVRGSLASGAGSPSFDWQIFSNPRNRE
jgi:hypothetical protein